LVSIPYTQVRIRVANFGLSRRISCLNWFRVDSKAMSTGKLVVGVTGASGAIYAQRFLMQAAKSFSEILLIMSDQAFQVAETELGVSLARDSFSTEVWLGASYPQIRLLSSRDYFTPPASGSFRHDGMVIVPCSMGVAGRIANGVSDDLMTRSADVCLKEGRKLIVIPREMPWNLIMLRNLTHLAEAGATIMPACPAWYHQPQTLEDLADTVVARILQNLGVEQDLVPQWAAE
jgi:4-hydroxy-3-polyprenylbenzoate decarboxylase